MATITNLVQNPKFQSNANYWALDGDFTANYGTGGAVAGGYVAQSSVGGFANFTTVNDSNGYAVTPDTDYVFSFYFKISALSGNAPIVQMNGGGAFGETLGVRFLFNTSGAWVRTDIAFNSGEYSLVYMRLFNNGGNVTAEYSNFMLQLDPGDGDPTDWFDGDSVKTNYTYAWLGGSNDSASTETALFEEYTKTFTTDAIVKVNDLEKSFTFDAIIYDPGDDTPPDFIIYELMEEEPSGTFIDQATYISNYVRLTEKTNSNDGQLEYLKSFPATYAIEADFYADGDAEANYIYWGCSSTPQSENAMSTGGYVVSLDEDDGYVDLFFNGSIIASTELPYFAGDAEIRTLKVVVEGVRIYVYVNNVLFIDYEDEVRVLGGTRCGVGARTSSSENAEHRCYRLVAYPVVAPYMPQIIKHGLSDLPIRSISTMKWVKDLINNQPTVAQIRAIIKTLDETFDLTHIELAIPLNIQQDYLDVGIVPGPYMSITTFFQIWCDEIHARGLGVLFRGAFNETELSSDTGLWNSILKVGVNRIPTGSVSSAPTDGQATWLGRIHSVIVNNPTWFKNGDLWGPMPERTENNTRFRSPTSVTRDGNIATFTFSANHDVGDGQPIRVSGADQDDYNGGFIATKVSDNVFTIEVENEPTTPATGSILVTFGVSVFSDENAFLSNEGQESLLILRISLMI